MENTLIVGSAFSLRELMLYPQSSTYLKEACGLCVICYLYLLCTKSFYFILFTMGNVAAILFQEYNRCNTTEMQFSPPLGCKHRLEWQKPHRRVRLARIPDCIFTPSLCVRVSRYIPSQKTFSVKKGHFTFHPSPEKNTINRQREYF